MQFLVARVTSHPNKHLLLFLKLFEEVKERFLPGGQVCPKLACFFQNLLDFVSGKFLVFPSLLHHLVQNRLKPVRDLTVSPHEAPELLWSCSHLLFSSRFSFCAAPTAASGSFCLRRSTFSMGPAGSSCHHGAQTDRPPSRGTLAVPREPGSSSLASGALPEGGACVLRTACVRPNDGAGLQRLSFRSGWNSRNKDSTLKADSLNEVPHCPRLCTSGGSRRSGPRQALTPADATEAPAQWLVGTQAAGGLPSLVWDAPTGESSAEAESACLLGGEFPALQAQLAAGGHAPGLPPWGLLGARLGAGSKWV